MQARSVPPTGPRYWSAMAVASVFGANMGDFVSHDLHMGHVRGVPFLAALFALILLADRMSRRGAEAWYWLAIVTLRTAATNLADLATHDGALGYVPVVLVLAALLVCLLLVRRAVAPEPVAQGVPRTDGFYWAAMLTAGTLGTALGDGLADAMRLPVATVVTAAAVLAALALRRGAALRLAASYWVTVVAIRTFGTNAGDMSADALGLPASTLLTGCMLMALLVLWRSPAVERSRMVL